MDTTTLLIIIIIVLLVGGGGWYGRGRWFSDSSAISIPLISLGERKHQMNLAD